MNWKISQAKQEFSKLVEESAKEIQWIYNREKAVAAMVSATEAVAFLEWKKQREGNSLKARLERLTQVCAETDYTFTESPREDRASDFGS
jgi:predicted ArsR family transcriptional regulator